MKSPKYNPSEIIHNEEVLTKEELVRFMNHLHIYYDACEPWYFDYKHCEENIKQHF